MRLAAHEREVELVYDDEADHISRRIAESQDFYERALLEDCWDRAPAGCVIDCGAHIGNHTLWFAGVMGRRTEAFEPNPTSWRQLVANVARNGLERLVGTHQVALGAGIGWCVPTQGAEGNTGSNSVCYGMGDVRVVAIDDLHLRPGVIKIDVEDCVMEVLKGATETLLASKPVVYVETGAFKDQADSLLVDLGYKHMGWLGATPTHIYEVP